MFNHTEMQSQLRQRRRRRRAGGGGEVGPWSTQVGPNGDSMRKYACSRRKLAKAGRPSENMHAARRCDGCENMQTVTNTDYRTRFANSSRVVPHPLKRLYPRRPRPSGAPQVHLEAASASPLAALAALQVVQWHVPPLPLPPRTHRPSWRKVKSGQQL